ncbi:hypothetical protein ES703_117428 [subsurface metagenome]
MDPLGSLGCSDCEGEVLFGQFEDSGASVNDGLSRVFKDRVASQVVIEAAEVHGFTEPVFHYHVCAIEVPGCTLVCCECLCPADGEFGQGGTDSLLTVGVGVDGFCSSTCVGSVTISGECGSGDRTGHAYNAAAKFNECHIRLLWQRG